MSNTQHIEDFFLNWRQDACEQTAIEGFVVWAWNLRKCMAYELSRNEYEEIVYSMVYDIDYRLRDSPLGEDSLHTACLDWLALNRVQLIDALVESLAEQIEAPFDVTRLFVCAPDEVWRLRCPYPYGPALGTDFIARLVARLDKIN